MRVALLMEAKWDFVDKVTEIRRGTKYQQRTEAPDHVAEDNESYNPTPPDEKKPT